jgi:hypothetical protein
MTDSYRPTIDAVVAPAGIKRIADKHLGKAQKHGNPENFEAATEAAATYYRLVAFSAR